MVVYISYGKQSGRRADDGVMAAHAACICRSYFARSEKRPSAAAVFTRTKEKVAVRNRDLRLAAARDTSDASDAINVAADVDRIND